MEQKVNKLLEEATKMLGDDADVLIVAHSNGKCASVVHGNNDILAQSIFACIHLPNNAIGNVLYRMIKAIILNIITNPSPFAEDLFNSLEAVADKMSCDEKSDNTSKKGKAVMMPLIPEKK